ncbi:hypothetical protein BLNAU_11164 [Blattamonas nauphoetae]|uniref:Uncharacterized protein n=1 Tax=Blattamonas nauphoetae TaxID=2049346 RepID=A0ABQ9XS59_9EUKA|nr:hypothetical protein BLNAU_11164 [Blattamonas nauphoetae]
MAQSCSPTISQAGLDIPPEQTIIETHAEDVPFEIVNFDDSDLGHVQPPNDLNTIQQQLQPFQIETQRRLLRLILLNSPFMFIITQLRVHTYHLVVTSHQQVLSFFSNSDLLCSYNSTGMDASSQLQLRHAKVAKAGFLFTKSRALSPSPPILPMKLFTLSAYNFIANHTVRRYSTKQTGQPPVYHTILTREDLVRYIRMLKNVFITISVHPPTHSGHPLFFPNQTDLLQNSISSSLFVVPLQEKRWRYKHAKVQKRENDDIPANPPISPQIQHFVRLTNALSLSTLRSQSYLNQSRFWSTPKNSSKTGNSRHAIGLTRHRPRLATAARLHLHPLAARLLRRTPRSESLDEQDSFVAKSDIETIATFVRADRQKKGLSPHPICTQHLRQFISSPSIRHFLSLRVLAGIKEAETRV